MENKRVKWTPEFLERFSCELAKHPILLQSFQDCTGLSNSCWKRQRSEARRQIQRALGIRWEQVSRQEFHKSYTKVLVKLVRRYGADANVTSREVLERAPRWVRDLEPHMDALPAVIARRKNKPPTRDKKVLLEEVVCAYARALHELRDVSAALRCAAQRTGHSCAHISRVWSCMRAVCMQKLRLLQCAGDAARGVTLEPLDWLATDLALLYHRHTLLDEESLRDYSSRSTLTTLFAVVQRALEPAPAHTVWLRALAAYRARGLVSSVVVLQRRWYELVAAARRRLSAASAGRDTRALPPLIRQIGLRYPDLMTTPQPSWEELVSSGKVYVPQVEEYFKEPEAISAPDVTYIDDVDDLILVERDIETIDLAALEPDAAGEAMPRTLQHPLHMQDPTKKSPLKGPKSKRRHSDTTTNESQHNVKIRRIERSTSLQGHIQLQAGSDAKGSSYNSQVNDIKQNEDILNKSKEVEAKDSKDALDYADKLKNANIQVYEVINVNSEIGSVKIVTKMEVDVAPNNVDDSDRINFDLQENNEETANIEQREIDNGTRNLNNLASLSLLAHLDPTECEAKIIFSDDEDDSNATDNCIDRGNDGNKKTDNIGGAKSIKDICEKRMDVEDADNNLANDKYRNESLLDSRTLDSQADSPIRNEGLKEFSVGKDSIETVLSGLKTEIQGKDDDISHEKTRSFEDEGTKQDVVPNSSKFRLSFAEENDDSDDSDFEKLIIDEIKPFEYSDENNQVCNRDTDLIDANDEDLTKNKINEVNDNSNDIKCKIDNVAIETCHVALERNKKKTSYSYVRNEDKDEYASVNPVATESIDPASTESVDLVGTESVVSESTKSIQSFDKKNVAPVAIKSADPVSTQRVDSVSTESIDPVSTQRVDSVSTESIDPVSTERVDSVATESVDPVGTENVEFRSPRFTRRMRNIGNKRYKWEQLCNNPDFCPRLPLRLLRRNRRLLALCSPLTVDLVPLPDDILTGVSSGARRPRKRVELADIEEVRRVNRRLPSAHVAPTPLHAATSHAVVEEDSSRSNLRTSQNDTSENYTLTPAQLEAVLKEEDRAMPTGAAAQYCCAARRHLAYNSARCRLAARAGRQLPPTTDLHGWRHGGKKCDCCCAGALKDAPSTRALEASVRELRRQLERLITVNPSAPSSSSSKKPVNKENEHKKKTTRLQDQKKEREKKQREKKQKAREDKLMQEREERFDDEYQEWQRQKSLYTKYFHLNNITRKPKSTQKQAETTQKQAETTQEQAETTQKQAETTHKQAETTQTQAETTQKQTETLNHIDKDTESVSAHNNVDLQYADNSDISKEQDTTINTDANITETLTGIKTNQTKDVEVATMIKQESVEEKQLKQDSTSDQKEVRTSNNTPSNFVSHEEICQPMPVITDQQLKPEPNVNTTEKSLESVSPALLERLLDKIPQNVRVSKKQKNAKNETLESKSTAVETLNNEQNFKIFLVKKDTENNTGEKIQQDILTGSKKRSLLKPLEQVAYVENKRISKIGPIVTMKRKVVQVPQIIVQHINEDLKMKSPVLPELSEAKTHATVDNERETSVVNVGSATTKAKGEPFQVKVSSKPNKKPGEFTNNLNNETLNQTTSSKRNKRIISIDISESSDVSIDTIDISDDNSLNNTIEAPCIPLISNVTSLAHIENAATNIQSYTTEIAGNVTNIIGTEGRGSIDASQGSQNFGSSLLFPSEASKGEGIHTGLTAATSNVEVTTQGNPGGEPVLVMTIHPLKICSLNPEQLNAHQLSVAPPIRVADFVQGKDPTNIQVLCVDLSRALWQLSGQYLVTTERRLAGRAPSYWTLAPDYCCRLLVLLDETNAPTSSPTTGQAESNLNNFFRGSNEHANTVTTNDAASSITRRTSGRLKVKSFAKIQEENTSPASLTAPVELVADDKLFRKLTDDPLVYAQVWSVVSDAEVCRGLVRAGAALALYCRRRGVLLPLLRARLGAGAAGTPRMGLSCPTAPQAVTELIQLMNNLDNATAPVIDITGAPSDVRHSPGPVNKVASKEQLVPAVKLSNALELQASGMEVTGVTRVTSGISPVPSGMVQIRSGVKPISSGVTQIRSGVTKNPSHVTPIPSGVTPIPSRPTRNPREKSHILSGVTQVPSSLPQIPSEVINISSDSEGD